MHSRSQQGGKNIEQYGRPGLLALLSLPAATSRAIRSSGATKTLWRVQCMPTNMVTVIPYRVFSCTSQSCEAVE